MFLSQEEIAYARKRLGKLRQQFDSYCYQHAAIIGATCCYFLLAVALRFTRQPLGEHMLNVWGLAASAVIAYKLIQLVVRAASNVRMAVARSARNYLKNVIREAIREESPVGRKAP